MVSMVTYTPVMLSCVLHHLILLLMWTIAVTSIGENKTPVKLNLSKFDYERLGLPIPKLHLVSESALRHENRTEEACIFQDDDQITVLPISTCNITEIILKNHVIEVLRKDNLTNYISGLKQIRLESVHRFHRFEPGVFRNADELHTIYVSDAPNLITIDDKVFQEKLPNLTMITITRSGLRTLPYLGTLTNSILSSVNFAHNAIQVINATRCTNVGINLLILEYNEISSVENKAFQGSRIKTLRLKGNRALKNIAEDAFVGLEGLKELDLSETSINALPTNGLENIQSLTIEHTKNLETFPSVITFTSITTAKLTYPYHCCAFSYPELQDPGVYKKYQEDMEEHNKKCQEASPSHENSDTRSRRSSNFNPSENENWKPPYATPTSTSITSDCPKFQEFSRNVECSPKPDAFNPCEDIMGNWVLRVAIWLVAILAIVGNFAVLVVLIAKIQMTVPKFLMCNLSFADLCMGLYLILIADSDARSIGAYFNYAIDWQKGLGCQIAGFLAVFSTELSIFTLTVITMERWYTINFAILNRRLRLRTCVKIMAAGWSYACIMALLPIFGVSRYSTTSICLPLEHMNTIDLLYLIILFAFTVIAFVMIVACYGLMYSSIRVGRRTSVTSMDHSDATIARRMAILIFADFACWAPIAFFSFTTLISREPVIAPIYIKILVVFFYPFNSCVNPYLYAFLTHQYRRDFFALLTQCGMCKSRAAQYNFAAFGLPLTNRRGNPNTRDNSAPNDTQKNSSNSSTMQNGNHIIPNKVEK
ncbi:lutropin-choriogonadotropic hormone receptor isoform X3 [Neodiprion virginianus]|uniref:lutropin-choriogonadotropic hormone receptor isoform X3 n=1 Tax=Neodiprion virginianus TaxID=2961670 RepID=UPI001EE6C6D4|nr:lutropin-choriogonadotropic hormone receptor isoform X3 [Neodiprion virginianus]